MQKKIFLPQLELSMENVAVTKWLVQPGERIKAEQPILQIETEKAVMDVPSPESGYLRQHCVSEGDTISGRTLLCILTDSPDEPIEDGDVELSSNARDSTHAPLPSTATQEAPSVALDSAIRTAPAARKLARESGIDLRNVKGSGPDGRITVDDVKSASRKTASEAS